MRLTGNVYISIIMRSIPWPINKTGFYLEEAFIQGAHTTSTKCPDTCNHTTRITCSMTEAIQCGARTIVHQYLMYGDDIHCVLLMPHYSHRTSQ